MAGGDVGVALRGEPRGLGVAGVARPRLQVALRAARAVDASGTPSRSHSAAQWAASSAAESRRP